MSTYTVIVFKQSETELDALFALNERLELLLSETYSNIAEAYEKLAMEQSRGNKAIILSDSLITELAVKAINLKKAS